MRVVWESELNFGGDAVEVVKKAPKPRPIDMEMDVPLGVFFCVKPTFVIDASNMFLTPEYESNYVVPYDVDIRELQKIKLVKRSMTSLREGDYVVVQHPGDGINAKGRRRGEVLRLPEDGVKSVKVLMIDLGIEEEFDVDKIYEMPCKFLDLKRLCIRFGLLNYAQLEDPVGKVGLKHELEHYFACHMTFVRVDLLLRSGTTPSRETIHFGEHWSPELKVMRLLVQEGYLEEKINPESLGGIDSCKSKSLVPIYFRQLEPTKKLPGSESVKCRLPSLPFLFITQFRHSTGYRHLTIPWCVERLISSYLSLAEEDLRPYRPWQPDTPGDICLIRHPKSTNWCRGRVKYLYKTTAAVNLIQSNKTTFTSIEKLKEAPSGLQLFLYYLLL